MYVRKGEEDVTYLYLLNGVGRCKGKKAIKPCLKFFFKHGKVMPFT